MGIRANILINVDNRSKQIQVYRHMDGDPDWTGKELVKFCREADWCKDNMMKMIESEPAYMVEKDATTIHNDLDWLYLVNLPNHTIVCYRMRPFSYVPNVPIIANRQMPIQLA